MNHKDYNGWTNYETWNVALWMDNDEGSYRHWRRIARVVWAMSEAGTAYESQTKEECAYYVLSERIKEEFEQDAPELKGCYADLLQAALSEVHWYEIAHHLIDEVKAEAA